MTAQEESIDKRTKELNCQVWGVTSGKGGSVESKAKSRGGRERKEQ